MAAAVIRWLLGDLPEREREEDSGLLVVWVCTIAAMGMWLALREGIKGGPMAVGAWRMVAHGCLPLAAVGLWELRAAWRRGGFRWGPGLLALAGTGVLLLPVGMRFTKGGGKWLVAQPELHMALPGAIGAMVLLMGLYRLGAKPEAWGIGFGDWRWWLPHHGVLLVGLIPVLIATTWLVPAMSEHYPMHKAARTSLDALEVSLSSLALDFVGWEFLFRGFMLFGIARRGDALVAILLPSIPFYLLHDAKPDLEMAASYFGGVLAGWFCLRARSFFPLYIIHVVTISTVSCTAYWIRNG